MGEKSLRIILTNIEMVCPRNYREITNLLKLQITKFITSTANYLRKKLDFKED